MKIRLSNAVGIALFVLFMIFVLIITQSVFPPLTAAIIGAPLGIRIAISAVLLIFLVVYLGIKHNKSK